MGLLHSPKRRPFAHIYRAVPMAERVANLTEGEPMGKQVKDAFGYFLRPDGTKLLYKVNDGSNRPGWSWPTRDGSRPRLIAPEWGLHYMAGLRSRE